jgi:hypothetical protein
MEVIGTVIFTPLHKGGTDQRKKGDNDANQLVALTQKLL